ncbi:MAG: translation elongation factor 4 [Armatimonadota bacterium]
MATEVRDISVPQDHIRNFCIIAHIDHGKSTLADRLLEMCGAVSEREMVEQVLDQMDLERERGITIKASAVTLEHRAGDGEPYLLNLIDTPGHVDFSYEVSRSLSACEGAVLVVDVSQGVEAQTVANLYMALEHDLTIIPVINKIDLPNVDVELVLSQLEEGLGLPREEVLLTSARTGQGVEAVVEAVVERVPPPQGDPQAPLRALVFDSEFDQYRGAIPYVRVMEGTVEVGDEIRMMSSGKSFEVSELGVFSPKPRPVRRLSAGGVGYLVASIKNVRDTRVGDTITLQAKQAPQALPGYREPKPMVFCGLYPTDTADYQALRDSLERLALNDAALHFEPEASAALGFGFRAGFLGLLHMDIVQERLEREYERELVATAPSVAYRVVLSDGSTREIDNPALWPEVGTIEEVQEPYVAATIITPSEFVGPCMELAQSRRGVYKDMEYMAGDRASLKYELPLADIIMEFFDQLKSRSRGYASLDYELAGFRPGDLVKVDILLNQEPADALAFVCHRSVAESRGRVIADRLKEVLPRQLFEVRIQVAIGSRIIAASRVRPLRKQVTAKCYGGDVTRKRKLLERQKEGKKRMKQVGQVEVPQEAFLSVLKIAE